MTIQPLIVLLMTVYIHSIATTLPDHRYDQEDLREKMKEQVASNDLERRLIHRIYTHSGIDSRHSVLGDFKPGLSAELYSNGSATTKGTAVRNDIYEREARKLFLKTADKLLENTGLSPSDITHLITISCTGFYAPGPDIDLIRQGGLPPDVERYHLGFMGCYAAISGLKLATRLCSSTPDANVMVVATELCSLHFQAGNSSDDLIATSLFADGSAGAILSGKPPQKPSYLIHDFASGVTPEGSNEMAWKIGDTGFRMTLSSYIPDLLSSQLPDILSPILRQFQVSASSIDDWAVHPGGRRILDRIEQKLQLPADSLTESRFILSRYGNMSSVTILFLLARILDRDEISDDPRTVLTMAFGPGLTLETAIMEKVQ